MATIMCTKKLWHAIGDGRTLPHCSDPSLEPGLLGVWGAKPVALPEGDFCVALHETTYLTLVLPLEPLPAFLAHFTRALASELEYLGIPGEMIMEELSASFERIEFARHWNRSLVGSLNDIGHNLGWVLAQEKVADGRAVARIQHWLNRMPHCGREMPFPNQAVSLLFSGASSA